MKLRGFDTAAFLRDFWQKEALLIRNPWGLWSNPLTPEELAGLACEEEVESRLIIGAGGEWTLEHGPVAEDRFARLSAKGWTLLVQAVDHHVPEVAALIEPFRFVPNWRIDDVMVSYAADQGSAGPHFDQYDVFLIQGLGRRRWQVGGRCDEASALLPHEDLRLLANFEARHEWVLEPGDILYVPPRVAHYGLALGDDCMTYSVGFRSPSVGELIGGWSEHVLAEMRDDERYRDPGLKPQDNPGEISARAMAELHAMVSARMGDAQAFARWFGEHSSTPKYPDLDWRAERPLRREELRDYAARGVRLVRNPASRFSFFRQGNEAMLLFVDGQSFECSGKSAVFAERLCAQSRLDVEGDLAQSEEILDLIAALGEQASLTFDDGAI